MLSLYFFFFSSLLDNLDLIRLSICALDLKIVQVCTRLKMFSACFKHEISVYKVENSFCTGIQLVRIWEFRVSYQRTSVSFPKLISR